jgi:hypothetical protein
MIATHNSQFTTHKKAPMQPKTEKAPNAEFGAFTFLLGTSL